MAENPENPPDGDRTMLRNQTYQHNDQVSQFSVVTDPAMQMQIDRQWQQTQQMQMHHRDTGLPPNTDSQQAPKSPGKSPDMGYPHRAPRRRGPPTSEFALRGSPASSLQPCR
ncbi:hypothetical protein DSL72_009027 [Monilinia vaccinii-corymbosi]|uniref:Uncharacterized protein n=1 Tax=Monilinia vaccinii-corymbosi TaxID=61207 RepID=A0A8A3PQ48_9HELO|nr:hypothetical protein DSL72_009027 [Monilinia vaccinii-corymbosi]